MSGLHHLRAGAGPPLVLLAGIGMSGDAFRPIVVWLHGCGHVPMSDCPEAVAQLLLEGSAEPAQSAPPSGAVSPA